jgi:N-acetylglucosaminyldiphosphoundecaprenol N-acetyl-beta-D-mannosaminyltransferase
VQEYAAVTLSLSGPATARHMDNVIPAFRDAIATKKPVMIDVLNIRGIDARFLGLLLMLRKELKGSGTNPIFIGLTPALKNIFRLNGLEFLLSSERGE